jgi:hypothetical protein
MTANLEEMLAEGLARYAETVTVPSGLVASARVRRRRRLVVRSGLAAASAVTVALGMVVLATGGSRGEPRMLTDAYVVKEVQAALAATDANDGKVMYATTGGPIMVPTTSWAYRDGALDRIYGLHGQARLAIGYLISGDSATYTFVNYATHTWARYHQGIAGAPFLPDSLVGLALTPQCGASSSTPLGGTLSWPEYLRSELACGVLHYAGHATVNGVRAIVLDRAPAVNAHGMKERLWVNAHTYLPIRAVVQEVPGRAYPMPGAGVLYRSTTDFQWLPPTQANLAKVALSIPAGFREVPG